MKNKFYFFNPISDFPLSHNIHLLYEKTQNNQKMIKNMLNFNSKLTLYSDFRHNFTRNRFFSEPHMRTPYTGNIEVKIRSRSRVGV